MLQVEAAPFFADQRDHLSQLGHVEIQLFFSEEV
jgi:hypothetical protein